MAAPSLKDRSFFVGLRESIARGRTKGNQNGWIIQGRAAGEGEPTLGWKSLGERMGHGSRSKQVGPERCRDVHSAVADFLLSPFIQAWSPVLELPLLTFRADLPSSAQPVRNSLRVQTWSD